MDYYKESLALHRALRGKIRVTPKIDVHTKDDLSLVYSPGVAEPCRAIAADPEKAYNYTIKGNTVAIITDGSAVLGLGNIGAAASIPVMEGKALLFKRFANIDAFPLCLDTQDTDEIVRTCQILAPILGGINLEDIAAPRSFEVEARLQDLGIPVFHDDQHGTAIVTLAALINAAKVVGKQLKHLKVVINGSGAAGMAIAKLLLGVDGTGGGSVSIDPVADIILCDSKGILSSHREGLNASKMESLEFSNKGDREGSVFDAIKGADVFIGVSVGDLLKAKDIKTMAPDSIVFAMANPTPEIMPEEAKAGGAKVVGTGRSDMPNQVNNVLGFPGIFRGALDARAKRITTAMKLAAAEAIAEMIREPNPEYVIPASLNEQVAWNVARAVEAAARAEGA
ncbi:MAG: NADP-dependent malic enzyme [Saprospiraceae bacterium]